MELQILELQILEQPIKKAMDYVKSLGADFADIRYKNIQTEETGVENGKLVKAQTEGSQGYGIRVYVKGAMGFAAASDLTKLRETTAEAVTIANASLTLLNAPAVLDKKEPATAHYQNPMEIDPLSVPLKDKLELMLAIDKNLNVATGVVRSLVQFNFRKDHVVFADTDGSYIVQDFCQ